MFCPKCGAEVREELNFCTKCGTSIKKDVVLSETPLVKPGIIIEDKPKQRQAGLIAIIIMLILIILGTGFLSFCLITGKRLFVGKKVSDDFISDWNDEDDLSESQDSDSTNDPSVTRKKSVKSVESNSDGIDADTGEMGMATTAGVDSDMVDDTAKTDVYEGGDTGMEDSTSIDSLGDTSENTGYILPNSDTSYLTEEDLKGLDAEQCRLARNEIYARRGRKFDDEGLQAYFNSCDWYTPMIEPDDFEESMLNDYEVANRDLIVAFEEEKGYR